MRRHLLPAIVIWVSVALAGCNSVAPHPETTPPASTPSPSSSSAPASVGQMVIGLDSISHERDGSVDEIALDDGAALLALFESLNGFMPTGTEIEIFPGYPTGLFTYEWSEVMVTVSDQGVGYSVVILAPTVNGVPIRTQEGIAVGSPRSDVITAGARDEWDEQPQDGIAEDLSLGSREVPGTHSLSRPGSVGSEFLLLRMDGDTVARIIVPANDFSDI